jgi:hypothetical protein
VFGDLRALQQPPQLQPTVSTQALASIAGQVVDGVTGRRVANAWISVYGVPVFDVDANPDFAFILPMWAGPSCSTRSDSEGRFTCTSLNPWPYEIVARKGGASGAFGQRSPESAGRVLTPTAGQRMQNVRVPLWPDAIVSGRVLDPLGGPLVNMTVVAIPVAALTTPSSDRERQLQRRTSTDDRGAYTLPVAPGEYLLAATAGTANPPRTEVRGRPAIYPTTFLGDTREAGLAQRLVLAAGTTYDDVNVTAKPVVSHRLTGRVSGPAPVVGAVVELIRDVAGGSPLSRETTYTTHVDESGRFSLPDVPADQYRLRILRAPQLPTGDHGNPPLDALPTESTLWANVPVVVGDDDLTVDVALDRGVRMSGRVVFEGGEAPPLASIARATFTLTPMRGQWMDARGLLLSPETFATIELIPGSYLLGTPFLPDFHVTSVTRGGRQILNEPLDVGTSDITDVVMTLSRQATTLSGRVTRPPALADTRGSVTIVPADSDAWKDLGRETRMQTVLIGMPGTFDLSPRPGDYLAIATDRPVPKTREGLALMEARATRVSLLPGSATRLNLQLQEWPR